ncbi:MAG: DMT family transporter [Methyloceanibacter sp.]
MTTSDTEKSKDNIVLGCIAATLAFASLAVMSALAKAASLGAPTEIIVFFQNLICLVVVTPLVLRQGWEELKTARIGLHLLRAVAGTGAWLGLFFAITLMPLTNAVLMTYTAPIWMPLIAWMLHGRKVGSAVWAGVGLGFIGIVMVLHPSNATLGWGAPMALGAAFLLALALLSVRWLCETEPNLRILFYYFLLSTLLILPFALVVWRTPEPWAWIYLAGIGLCLLASQVLLIVAYSYASAVTLAPIIYSVVVFTALINWAVWQRVPSLLEVAGMALVILGGVIAMKGGGKSETGAID